MLVCRVLSASYPQPSLIGTPPCSSTTTLRGPTRTPTMEMTRRSWRTSGHVDFDERYAHVQFQLSLPPLLCFRASATDFINADQFPIQIVSFVLPAVYMIARRVCACGVVLSCACVMGMMG